MTDLNKKLNAIKQLFIGEMALLERALKETLDFVEEYSVDFEVKIKIIDACWQLRQLKARNAVQEAAFAELKQTIVDTLERIAQNPNCLEKPDNLPIIASLQKIEKSYQSHHFTLNNISLDFFIGQITGIVGANANGKSTLIKIMVGELLPDSGELTFPHFTTDNRKKSWLELKKKISYISQDLPEWHGKLKDNLHVEATLHGITGKENVMRVDFILERLGLTEFTDRHWHELSGGYKLRFALAKALVWRPNFLVLDEPLANLDMASQMIVLQDLKELVQSVRFPLGIVITSQHIHEIEQIADQLVVLEQGKIVYEGEPNAFKADSGMLIFEFACTLDWSTLSEILQGSPLKSLQSQGKYFVAQYSKQEFSATQFLTFLGQKGVQLAYFRDISHSVKQLFLSA